MTKEKITPVYQEVVGCEQLAQLVLQEKDDQYAAAKWLTNVIREDAKKLGIDLLVVVYSSELKHSGDKACTAATDTIRYKVAVATSIGNAENKYTITLFRITYIYK